MFEIYKGKKVFITGHSGFKGSWLSLCLRYFGAEVFGYSLGTPTNPSMFKNLNIEKHISESVCGNILDEDFLEKSVIKFKPDIIFHLAAQPLVRLSYKEPVLTYKTNVMGTMNVLRAAKKAECALVNVTTDKCYENNETFKGYFEEDKLGGYDMYSSSKACSEILTASFRQSFNLNVASARSGNVIGGGDWAKDRLVPDIIRNINQGNKIEIRNPNAVRPWQHVLEPLFGYMLLGEKLMQSEKYAQAYNFGPDESNVYNVLDITHRIVELYGQGEIVTASCSDLHEAGILTLNSTKSKNLLGWSPKLNIEDTLKSTVEWYKSFYNKDVDMLDLTLSQMKEYEKLWNKN